MSIQCSLLALILLLGVALNVRADEFPRALAWQHIKAGAQVIDVRTPEEFAAGRLEGAKNIDYEEILNRLGQLHADKAKPIVLYCASGFRAQKALRALKLEGYLNVMNAGGYDELNAAVR